MRKAGVIGLGKMGRSMAFNIMKNGFDLVVYDVLPEAMEMLVEAGAEGALSLKELGETADPVLVMVNTYAQCRECLEGLLDGKTSGTVIIGSTINVDEVQALGKMAEERGVCVLDAPVSGGSAGAEKGTLTIMAAGTDETYDACLPLLKAYGANPIHVGKQIGQGQAMKAVNQLLVGIHMCAAAEAFNMGRACGLDLELMFNTVKESAGTSRIFENRGRFFIERNFDTRSQLNIQLKDTSIACRTAALAGAPTPFGDLSKECFERANKLFDPTMDSIAVIKLLEDEI